MDSEDLAALGVRADALEVVRHALITGLLANEGRAPTPGESLILIWSAYEKLVGAVETQLRRRGIQPLALGALKQAPPSVHVAKLRLLRGVDFDRYALQWLIAIDRSFRDGGRSAMGVFEARGVDGQTWLRFPRNDYLRDRLLRDAREGSSVETQGQTIRRYAPGSGVVLAHESVRVRQRWEWAGARLSRRLAKLAESDDLAVLLCPFAHHIVYRSLADIDWGVPPPFVHVRDPLDVEQLRREALDAVAYARANNIAVVVFPELAIPPEVEHSVQDALRAHGDGMTFPILTVVSRCHALAPGEAELDLNEAALLGPDGRVLHTHAKMSVFAIPGPARDDDARPAATSEQLLPGDRLDVLESPIGNIATPICLDLFHDNVLPKLKRSLANLLLVPSLSPKTSAHRAGAAELGHAHHASSFVCNRTLLLSPDRASHAATSFCHLPAATADRRDGRPSTPPGTSYVVFRLRDLLEPPDHGNP